MDKRSKPPLVLRPEWRRSEAEALDEERTRPTVQELGPLSAEVVASIKRREVERLRRLDVRRTRKEMRGQQDSGVLEAPAEGGREERQEAPSSMASMPAMPEGRLSLEVLDPGRRGRSTIRLGGAAMEARRIVSAELGPATVPEFRPEPAQLFALEEMGPGPGPVRLEEAPFVPAQGAVRAYAQQPRQDVDGRLVMLRAPDSPQAAAYRVLRHRIEQTAEGYGTSVLAVCAPHPGQGATTAAANLALALSECNRARVCLVEGNLRRPALARLFGFKPPQCLAERMSRDRDQPMQPWCVAELLPGLHALAMAEDSPPRPLLDGPSFSAAVDAMRRSGYRHVIIDAPVVLGIADMNLIEEVVDGVLLVAQGGQTKASDLRLATAQIGGGKLRGIVLLDGDT
jgi:Mrp family chromosome partitioning ATPase